MVATTTFRRSNEQIVDQPGTERVLVRLAASGDRAAGERLVGVFWPHMSAIARTYWRLPSVDRAELMQEGVAGLLTALHRYDAQHGTPFWAYASWWVRQAMQRFVSQVTGPVVLSDRAARCRADVRRARHEHLQNTGRDPSIAELARRTGLGADQVAQLMSVERPPRGLDEPLAPGDAGYTLGDRIADPSGEDGYVRVLDGRGIDVRRLPERLDARERAIVRARYGLDQPPQTLRELAGGLNVSVERVRQLEERALERLRRDLE